MDRIKYIQRFHFTDINVIFALPLANRKRKLINLYQAKVNKTKAILFIKR